MRTYKLIALLGFGLIPSLLFAQYYKIDIDLQDPGKDWVLDRVFTGNTIGLEAKFYDGTTPYVVTNWTMFFRYGRGQYDTNGMVPVRGVASSNRVVFESVTNLFFSPSENYYFSISGVDGVGRKRTFARGRMIEEYDPSTAGSGGVLSNGFYYIGWGNIFGNVEDNQELVDYISSGVTVTNASDSQARATGALALATSIWSSNTAAAASSTGTAAYALAATKVPTNDPRYLAALTNAAAFATAAQGAKADTALQSESDPLWAANSNAVVRTNDSRLTDSRTPLAHTQGWHSITGAPYTATHLWVDFATNYHATLANNASTYSSTSFSATLMWAITNSGDPPVIELGPSAIGTGHSVRTYEIDAPIMIGGGQGIGGFTLRGQGNLGSHVTIKSNYTGQLFVLTNMVSIGRFESIRFADNLLTANTNPVIHSEITELVIMDCEFTGFLGGSIRHHPSFHSAWNKVQDSWFVRTRANEAPSIDLLTTPSTTFIDFQISDCHFWQQAGGTNADIRITGPRSAYAQIHGNRFYSANTTATNGTIVELAGGFGASVNDNVFIVRDTGTTPIRFTAATSNNYRAIISGNNFAPISTSPVAYGINTNAVVVGANSHDIAIVGNKLGAAEVRVASGATGVFQLNTTSDIPANASTWWQYPAEGNVDMQGNSINDVANLVGTNNSIYTTTVAKAASALQSVPWGEATTNNMTNVNWAALGNDGGWTNLAFAGSGNAITGATADATTLTLQRGTIEGGGGTTILTNASGERGTIWLASTSTTPTVSPTNYSWGYAPTVSNTLTIAAKADATNHATVRVRCHIPTGVTCSASGFAWPAGIVPPFIGELEFVSLPSSTNWSCKIAERRVAGVPTAYDDAVSVWWPSRTGSTADMLGRNNAILSTAVSINTNGLVYTSTTANVSYGCPDSEWRLEPKAGDFSISVWVNPSTNQEYQMAIGRGFQNIGDRWNIGAMATNSFAGINGVTEVSFIGPICPTGAWSHLALVRRDSVGVFYFNGVPVQTQVVGRLPLYFNQKYGGINRTPFTFGNYYNGSGEPNALVWAGYLDAGCFSTRAWTDAEVSQLFTIGRTP